MCSFNIYLAALTFYGVDIKLWQILWKHPKKSIYIFMGVANRKEIQTYLEKNKCFKMWKKIITEVTVTKMFQVTWRYR